MRIRYGYALIRLTNFQFKLQIWNQKEYNVADPDLKRESKKSLGLFGEISNILELVIIESGRLETQVN